MCFTKHTYQPTSTLTMLCKITTPSGLKGAIRRTSRETLSLTEICLEILGKNTPYTDPHETFDPVWPIYLTAESMSIIINIGVAFQAMNILNSVNGVKSSRPMWQLDTDNSTLVTIRPLWQLDLRKTRPTRQLDPCDNSTQFIIVFLP